MSNHITDRATTDRTFQEPIIWSTTLFMLMFHVLAVVALFFFTWKALAVAVLLWWVAGSLGIGMSYHRLLTHRGYKTTKWMEYFLTTCGTLALEGGPIAWVATHRKHHQNTDKEGDPHSPRDGGIWAHMGWIVTGKAMHAKTDELLPYVPDLRKDRFHLWISEWHWVPLAVLGVGLYFLGGVPFGCDHLQDVTTAADADDEVMFRGGVLGLGSRVDCRQRESVLAGTTTVS